MNRVLVIDDEPFSRRTLCAILRMSDVSVEVDEAKNGKEALTLHLQNHYDVFFCDIRMPVMDGLTLIKKVRATDQRARFVILSGYEDFSYAQQAIHLNVTDYLLKPIEKEKVYQSLYKAIDELQQNQNRFHLIYELQNYLDENHSMDNSFLDTVLATAGFIQICIAEPLNKKETAGFLNLLDKFMPLQTDNLLCFCGSWHQIPQMIIISGEQLYNDLTGISHPSLQILSRNTVLSFSSQQIPTRAGILLGLEQAKNSMQKHFYHPDCTVCSHYVEPSRIDGMHSIVSFSKKWIESLPEGQEERKKNIQQLLFESNGEEWPPPNILKSNVIHALEFLHHEVSLPFTALQVDAVQSCYTLPELLEWLSVHLKKASLNIAKLKQGETSKALIAQCQRRMRQEFSCMLSLNIVAEWYHFTPSYFSRLFKRYSGVSFSEYMTTLRIDRAAQLLRTTNLKIYNVAEKVGYQDVKYFSRQFKEHKGVSPERYRSAGALYSTADY